MKWKDNLFFVFRPIIIVSIITLFFTAISESYKNRLDKKVRIILKGPYGNTKIDQMANSSQSRRSRSFMLNQTNLIDLDYNL